MNYRIRLMSLLLSVILAISLIGCSNTDSSSTTPSPSEAPDTTETPESSEAADSSDSILPEDFVVDPSVEDLCLATADIPGDFELFTVDGIPVSARLYLYWLAYSTSEVEAYYGLDWAADSALAEYLKSDALNAAVVYTLVEAKAKEHGCELSQEQLDELDYMMITSSAYLGGEEALEKKLRQAGLDQDTYYKLNSAAYYYQQLLTGLFNDRPTEQEMDAYIEENDILMAKHILLSTVDLSTRQPLEESVVAQKKAAAEDILTQLQASDDLAATFDALMQEHSEDPGLLSYPDGYTFTADEMVPEFESATRALEYGQISGLVESSSTGYHIILRLDPDTEDARQAYRADLLDARMQEWISAADIVLSDEYLSLNPQLFYEKFMAYQEAFVLEAESES